MLSEEQIKETKDKIVITIDKTKEGVPSKSGKTLIVAGTNGFQRLGDGFSLNLNLTKKNPDYSEEPEEEALEE